MSYWPDLLNLSVHEDGADRQVIAVLSQHDEEVEKELVTVTVDHLLVVVQAKEDDVEHQGHVDAPVHAVTVKVQAVHHQLRQQDHGEVAPVEIGDGDGGVRKELGQWSKPTYKIKC